MCILCVEDLPCRASFFTANGRYVGRNKERLYLGGCSCQTYLLFDTPPPAPALSKLCAAKLILYKVPAAAQGAGVCRSARYSVSPLLDYERYCGECIAPVADIGRKVEFTDDRSSVYTETDVTDMVKAWVDGEIQCKGFWLTGGVCAPVIVFASSQYSVEGMRPILQLQYMQEQGPLCQPLVEAPCTVRVQTM